MAEGQLLNPPNKEQTFELFILRKGLITQAQLGHITSIQKKYKEDIHKIILSEGILTSQALYSLMSQYYDINHIDIDQYPCDKSLFIKDKLKVYISLEFVPWKKVGSKIYFATSFITPELLVYLKSRYNDDFQVVFSFSKNIIKSIQDEFNDALITQVKTDLKTNCPNYSAYKLLDTRQKFSIIFVLSLLFTASAYLPYLSLIVIMTIANIAFLFNTLFKALLFYQSLKPKEKFSCTNKATSTSILPIYTILLPLYKEEESISGLLKCIRSLDYPKSRLDVLILVEKFDKKTKNKLKKENIDDLYTVITVPKCDPQTKPKACSYGLHFAKGKYVTIYDADDRPEPLQLLKAVAAFNNAGSKTRCLQAKLNYYNREQSVLSYMFSLEYFALFNAFLYGLQSINIPIPLGGNSNHFHAEDLKYLKAWDPYNVTEDADIGYRLAQHGYNAKILDSDTLEESPITIKVWLMQRARWIKGYIQTHFVHSRNLINLVKKQGIIALIGFYAFCILPIISYALLPITLIIFAFAPYSFNSFTPYLLLNLILGIIVLNGIALYGILKNKWYKKSWTLVIYPFYYILHSVATFISLYELIFKPHVWNKTPHTYLEEKKGDVS